MLHEHMLAIKLQRIGKKHHPAYRIVVAPKRSKMAAPPVEDLGSYDPATKKASVKKERVAHWVRVGARPTPTVHNLLIKEGALNSPKVAIKINKKASAGAPTEASAEAPAQAS